MNKKDKSDSETVENAENEAVNTEAQEEMSADTEELTADAKDKKKKSKKKKGNEKLEMELEEKEAALSEAKDKYLRMYAEFENFKKRSVRQRIELMNSAAQDTLIALLPVLDDFDRAKKNAEDEANSEPFSEGVNLVYNKLHNILKQRGLEEMESNGETFDPDFHEAITKIPAPSDDLKGKVIDTVEKGYKLKDKIIRHAKVVVGE